MGRKPLPVHFRFEAIQDIRACSGALADIVDTIPRWTTVSPQVCLPVTCQYRYVVPASQVLLCLRHQDHYGVQIPCSIPLWGPERTSVRFACIQCRALLPFFVTCAFSSTRPRQNGSGLSGSFTLPMPNHCPFNGYITSLLRCNLSWQVSELCHPLPKAATKGRRKSTSCELKLGLCHSNVSRVVG